MDPSPTVTADASAPPLAGILTHPDAAAIAAAYRASPRRSYHVVLCRPAALGETLAALEASGFIGLTILPESLGWQSIEITAHKGKVGPCFETGRSARYLGSAAAALDDDSHVLTGELRVCEKTALVYSLPPYRGVMRISPPDETLLAHLDHDPVPFDCNTLDRDFAALLNGLPPSPPEPTETVVLLYPGPFRALILKDGTLMRRGVPVRVDSALAHDLANLDACIDLTGRNCLPSEPPVFVQKSCPHPLAFLDACSRPHRSSGIDLSTQEPDYSSLASLGTEFAARLRTMIADDQDYILLTGTSPDDEFGCCPSEEIGDAIRLERAGILQSFRRPAPPDACPVTVFACAGEIESGEDGLRFVRTTWIRQALTARLGLGGQLEDRGRTAD